MSTQTDLLSAFVCAVEAARAERRAAAVVDDEVEVVRCESCTGVLGDDNAAPTCTEHPRCIDCYDPAALLCRGCRDEELAIATDREDDRRADLSRDKD